MREQQQFATFRLAGHLFGVQVERVREVLRYHTVTPVPHAPEPVAGLINLRGEIVTALSARRRLGFPECGNDSQPMNVVLRAENGVVSLLVDEIGDVLNVCQEDFEEPPQTLSGTLRELILGAYKLECGLLLQLDPDKVLSLGQMEN